MASLWNLETMLIIKVFPVCFYCFFELFIPHVTNPLEKHQRQDVTLPVRTVHWAAAQDISGFPEVAFEGGEGKSIPNIVTQ
jgi:hypothetical protein